MELEGMGSEASVKDKAGALVSVRESQWRAGSCEGRGGGRTLAQEEPQTAMQLCESCE